MNRNNLIDVREERHLPARQFELRVSDDSDELILTGYASTFEPYEMYGGPAEGGWIEQLDKSAFDKTLREKPDLHLLINHEGMPLARTKSGTLALSTDSHGLKVEAKLDRSDPDVQRLEAKMRRGDMDEMSFAFRVKSQKWTATDDFPDDDYAHRTITEVSLHKGDVSVVNFGANPTTSAELKSIDQALKLIADSSPQQLAEVRSDSDLLRRARQVLDGIGKAPVGTRLIDAAKQAQVAAAHAAEAAATATDIVTPKRKGMSMHEALRRQGLAPDDGKPMSLEDALNQIDPTRAS